MRCLAPLLVAAMACGCAHGPHASPGGDPSPLVAAYARAVAADRPDDAWRLLSPALRRRISQRDFALAWRAAAADLAAEEPWLRRPWTLHTASGELPDGRALPLARDGNLWRIAGARPEPLGGDTPEDALRLLLAALDAHDSEAILALLAEPLRTSVEQAITDRTERLRAALRAGTVESSGSPLRIRYDSRYHVDLVQENGRWRIADFN